MRRISAVIVVCLLGFASACQGDEPTTSSRESSTSALEGDNILAQLVTIGWDVQASNPEGSYLEERGLEPGGEDLTQYLPSQADVGDGFENFESSSHTFPEDREFGSPGGEFAAATWATPDFVSDDPSQARALTFIVFEPTDPEIVQHVAGEYSDFLEDELKVLHEAQDRGDVQDLQAINSDSLGPTSAAAAIELDLSEFVSGVRDLYGEGISAKEEGALAAVETMRMRLYLFSAGERFGMLIQTGFKDAKLDEGDLRLAETLFANLTSESRLIVP